MEECAEAPSVDRSVSVGKRDWPGEGRPLVLGKEEGEMSGGARVSLLTDVH